MLLKEKQGLAERNFCTIGEILYRNKKIEHAVLFGSRAIGNHLEGSDIDIALKEKKLCLQDILNASIALDELFLPSKFNLILYDRITEKALREHIDKYGTVLERNN